MSGSITKRSSKVSPAGAGPLAALDRSRPGDLVVPCVDHATEVYSELERRRGVAAPPVLPPSEDGKLEAVGGDPHLLAI